MTVSHRGKISTQLCGNTATWCVTYGRDISEEPIQDTHTVTVEHGITRCTSTEDLLDWLSEVILATEDLSTTNISTNIARASHAK